MKIRLSNIELEAQLAGLNFLNTTKLRSAQRMATLLPIYMIYKEYRGVIWEKETLAWDITIPTSEIILARKEKITPGIFTHQFMLPPFEGPAFPDLFLINGSFFKFWLTGDNWMTRPAEVHAIGREWMQTIQSYKDYVIFKSPLGYDTSSKTTNSP